MFEKVELYELAREYRIFIQYTGWKHYKAICISMKRAPIRSRNIVVWMSQRRPLEWHVFVPCAPKHYPHMRRPVFGPGSP
jgi:hypothetical protein